MNDPHWSHQSEGPVGGRPDDRGEFNGFTIASWGWRFGAGIVDYLILAAIPFSLLNNAIGFEVGATVGLTIILANSGFMAAKTGQSLGKRIFGIRMHWAVHRGNNVYDLCFVPVPMAMLRVACHALDHWLCFTGWFAPILTYAKGTYADYLCKTINYRDHRLPPAIPYRGGGYVDYPGKKPKKLWGLT